jgi:hypothetical protein
MESFLIRPKSNTFKGKQMKKILAGLLIALAGVAHADYKIIVPQEPGGGTSVWASIVAKEWEKKLGEKIVLEHIPGARDIPGANKFQNELRFDPKTIMVAHGGNAESYLIEKVDYKYSDWEPIGLMNLSIVVGYRKDQDPYKLVKFAAGSGNNPDAMAITMLICGPKKTTAEYQACYNEKFKFVNGMSANERRLSYMRGELNVQRETPSAYNKFLVPIKENELWFSHGILDLKTGKVVKDSNYPEAPSFQEVYKKKWGVEPSGDLYDAYLLAKQYRDVLQKSLWVNKGNPNTEKLRSSLQAMLNDPVSIAAIEKDAGKYPWIVGKDVNKAMAVLDDHTTKKALKDLILWSSKVFGVSAIYKEDIAKTAK